MEMILKLTFATRGRKERADLGREKNESSEKFVWGERRRRKPPSSLSLSPFLFYGSPGAKESGCRNENFAQEC